jgi:REP element-mobilizing transposase RayT
VRTGKAEEIAVIAYCLMPDHLHLVVEGRCDGADCLEFVRVFKQTTAFARKKEHGGQLWQDSFFDHVLRDTEATQRVVRYVLENPMRAGLVRYPWEYDHSGSLVYSREALFDWAFGTDRRALL